MLACSDKSKSTGDDNKDAASGIDYMALVNKLNPLPEGWEEALQTVTITNSVGDEVEVEKKAYDAYLKMKDDLEQNDGIYLELDSARRSIAAQQEIMDEFTEKYGADYALKTVAKPGYSEHHTGLALDLYFKVKDADGNFVERHPKYFQMACVHIVVDARILCFCFLTTIQAQRRVVFKELFLHLSQLSIRTFAFVNLHCVFIAVGICVDEVERHHVKGPLMHHQVECHRIFFGIRLGCWGWSGIVIIAVATSGEYGCNSAAEKDGGEHPQEILFHCYWFKKLVKNYLSNDYLLSSFYVNSRRRIATDTTALKVV